MEHEFLDDLISKYKIPDSDAPQIGGFVFKVDGFSLIESKYPWMDWSDLGWKSVTSAVSDIYSVAGIPSYFLISLGVRSISIAKQVLDGVNDAISWYGGSLLGGDLNRSQEDGWIDVFVIGNSLRHTPLSRSDGSLDNVVVQVGYAGLGSAGYYAYLKGIRLPEHSLVLEWTKRPKLPKNLPSLLSSDCVVASIDNSDGYALSLWLLSRSSGVVLNIEDVKFHPDAIQICPNNIGSLSYGEDYNLFLLVKKECFEEFVGECNRLLGDEWPCWKIGRIAGRGVGVYLKGSRLDPMGWSSF